MLLAHLPAESATARALSGPDPNEGWTRTELLLAGIFDALQVLAWQNANQGKKSPSPRPKPLPRPGVEQPGTHYGSPMPLSEVKAVLPGIERPIEVEEVS